MDNAVAPIPTDSGSAACRGTRLRRPTRRLAGQAACSALGIGVALLLAVVVALALWQAEGDYKVLYANLSDKDGGAIIAQLSQMNVPYQHADGGSAILVPASQVHDVRLQAGLGRPAQGRGRRLRADGQAPLRPDAVPGAPDLPARARRRTDALDQLAGRGAGRARAPGAAEPERLLPRTAEALRLGAADAAPRAHAGPRADRRHRAPGVEQRARAEPQGGQRARPDRRAAVGAGRRTAARASTRSSCSTCSRSKPATSSASSSILEPVVGRDNLRANVTADIDFSQTESTSEEFKPNQGDAAGRGAQPADAAKSAAPAHGRAQRRARRGQQPAAGAGHRADHRRRRSRCRPRRAAAAAAAAPRRRHQLRGRQDRARDAQCHRHASSG